MNVNKICAAVSALCFAGTAAMLSMNERSNNSASALERLLGDVNENGVVDAVDASAILTYYAYASAGHDDITLEQFMDMRKNNSTEATTVPQTTEYKPPENVKLESGGDTFTVAVWNMDDLPILVSTWLDVSERDLVDYFSSQAYRYDRIRHPDSPMFRTPSGAGLNIVNFGAGGGEAAEHYDQMFASGEDMDIFYCESYWMNRFTDNDTFTAPLSDLGFTDEDFAQTYKYTDTLGHNSSGVRKAVSPYICPGGFAYRTDLAQDYLGISSPSEMQNAIGTWDGFVSTASKLASNSKGNIALADSVAGMFYAYSSQNSVLDKNGTPTSSAKTFANYAKTLWNNGGVTKNSQWSDEWTDYGKKEKVMGYFTSTWGVNTRAFLSYAAENSGGKWDIVQGPEPFYWGGIWTVVNPYTDNADDCASFIRSSCINTDNMLKSAKKDNHYLPNNKTVVSEILADPTLSGMNENTVFLTNNYLSVFANTADKLNVPPVEYPSQLQDGSYLVNDIVSEHLKNNRTWDETVEYYNSRKRYR